MTATDLNVIATPYLFLLESLLHCSSDDTTLANNFSRLDEALRNFEHLALRHCGEQDIVEEASYLLCTFADELLVEHLGLAWSRHSLLVHRHAEAHGGEKCWTSLELILHAPAGDLYSAQHELLRLYEQVIALGLRGRYRLLSNGEQMVHQWRLRLHDRLHADDLREFQSRQLIELATRNLKTRQNHWFALIALLASISIFASVWLVDISLKRHWSELSSRMASRLKVIEAVAALPEVPLHSPGGDDQ